MSETSSYRLSTRLRLWQARRSTTALLRRSGPEGLELGACRVLSPRLQMFDAKLGEQVLQVQRRLGPEAAMLSRGELDVLEEASGRLGDGRDRVVPVVWAAPASGCLVTGVPEAPSFADALSARPELREHHLAAAARWLSSYTAPTAVEDRFGGGFWIRQRSEVLSSLRDGPDKVRLGTLIGAMRQARSVAGPRAITRARCHGDFRVGHLWIGDGTVWAGSLAPDGWGALARDTARFLVDLALMAPRAEPDGKGPLGLDSRDAAALAAGLTVARWGEMRALLPYFVAVDLSARLIHAGPEEDRLRALIDRAVPA